MPDVMTTRAHDKWSPVRTLVTVVAASVLLWGAIILSVASLVTAQ